MGTATYFSPEQAQGAQPHPRSDLYSLGIVMYEMVAGKPPFAGDNPVSIAYKQVHDQPRPLNQFVADIPIAYEAIVARLLAKDPAVRYPDADRACATTCAASATASRSRRSAPPLPQAGDTTADGAPLPATIAATTTMPATTVPRGHSPSAGPWSPDYDDSGSRSGWYVLAAFLALIALAIGGFLLFRALSDDDEAGALTLEDYTANRSRRSPPRSTTSICPTRPIPEENDAVPEDYVHRTDPRPPARWCSGDQLITLYFNPVSEPDPIPDVTDVPARAGPIAAAGRRVRASATRSPRRIPTRSSRGNVIRTDPAATPRCARARGCASSCPPDPNQIAVPSEGVVGFTEAGARDVLENEPYNFNVTVRTEPSNEMAAGLVDPHRTRGAARWCRSVATSCW